MAFPPNYSQERSNRERNKARKALDKQQKRDDKSSQRKTELAAGVEKNEPGQPDKESK